MNKYLICTFLLLLAAVAGRAQDLIYKPKNPNFGGETFNYQWLLSAAEAQNTYKDPKTTTTRSTTTNALDDFQTSLNRQLLSSLARQIVTDQFGETGLKPGSFTVGSFQVDVANSLDGLVVDILDSSTGQSTQVIIPYY